MAATTSAARSADGIDLDQLHAFTHALRAGDFSFRFPITPGMTWKAEEVAIGLNRHLEQMAALLSEVARVCDELGAKGTFGPQADHTFTPGPWRNAVDAVNRMACHLTEQVRDMNRTVTLIAAGDLTRPVTVDCDGETLELKRAINGVIERLSARPLEG